MTWRYHYPQRPFPYAELVHHGRGPAEPEYELVDTGVFAEDRCWAVTVDCAKADPTDLCVRITVENRGPEAATLHVLPTLWFRNTWAWGLPGQDAMPRISADGGGTLVAEHAELTLYYSSNSPSFTRSNSALLGIVQALAYGVYARDKAAFKDRIRAFKLK